MQWWLFHIWVRGIRNPNCDRRGRKWFPIWLVWIRQCYMQWRDISSSHRSVDWIVNEDEPAFHILHICQNLPFDICMVMIGEEVSLIWEKFHITSIGLDREFSVLQCIGDGIQSMGTELNCVAIKEWHDWSPKKCRF